MTIKRFDTLALQQLAELLWQKFRDRLINTRLSWYGVAKGDIIHKARIAFDFAQNTFYTDTHLHRLPFFFYHRRTLVCVSMVIYRAIIIHSPVWKRNMTTDYYQYLLFISGAAPSTPWEMP